MSMPALSGARCDWYYVQSEWAMDTGQKPGKAGGCLAESIVESCRDPWDSWMCMLAVVQGVKSTRHVK